jgi:glutathionylspermidine synthase
VASALRVAAIRLARGREMMHRINITPRRDWQRLVTEEGLVYHTDPNGIPYWREDAYYNFLKTEVDDIEAATDELYRLCLEAVEYVVANRLFERLGIDPSVWDAIEASWRNRDPSLYGRFDLAYTPDGRILMLEFNADTPTSLLEASIIQHSWRESVHPTADQFNSIHEALVAKFEHIQQVHTPGVLHFAALTESFEDTMTIGYLADTWIEARGGDEKSARIMDVSNLGWVDDYFIDTQDNSRIVGLFKLYPWEQLVDDQIETIQDPTMTTRARQSTLLLEPVWKMILSNKGILAILWELFPGHPNLLAAYTDGPRELTKYVRKPFFSREGANVRIVINDEVVLETTGEYDKGPTVYQELAEIPNCDGKYPIIGSWIVGESACGIGIREGNTPITNNTSGFVPHIFK